MKSLADIEEQEVEVGGHAEPDAATILRLATLPSLEYERVRGEEARRLGCRASTLDREVRRAQEDSEEEVELFPSIDLWPERVDGAMLLDALASAFSRHMVLPTGAADAIALWILHTHTHDTAVISPILAVTSPTPECGKTTLLTLLGALVPSALPASNITAAALFRSVEMWSPSLLVDEADTFLKSSDELRGVLNSGHNKFGAFIIRSVGDDHEPKRFKTWAPKAIALIGKLPATLASRSIHIELRRIAAGEKVEEVRGDRLGHLLPLAQQAARWANDNDVTFRSADPEMPPALTGRRADNWRHLFAIAEAAGGNWRERAARAAKLLTAVDSEQTAGIMLLDDIRGIFTERGTDRITSRALTETLAEMLDRPWPEWSKGRPITERKLASLLEPFKIKPKTIRTTTGTAKGYTLDAFGDAFSRYLSSSSVTPSQSKETAGLSEAQNVTRGLDVTDGNAPQTAENGHCYGVTDKTPEDAEERAAILEHDAGMTRDEAERQAWGGEL